jgi:hypothetical protein
LLFIRVREASMSTTPTDKPMSPGLPGRTRPDASQAVLERIDARLERIEARLAQLDPLLDAAPGLIATLGDSFDEAAAELDLHERVRAGLGLLERATRPETLAQLEAALDLLDALPGTIAVLGDTVDELAREAAARGLPVDRLVPELGRALEATLRLLTNAQIQRLLESDRLLPSAVEALDAAARAMAVAQEAASPRLGLFGALRAAREPEVQRALGFAIDVARRFGANLELPSGSTGHPSALPPAQRGQS